MSDYKRGFFTALNVCVALFHAAMVWFIQHGEGAWVLLPAFFGALSALLAPTFIWRVQFLEYVR